MQEAQQRYYQLKKLKPVLYLTTVDGALLSKDDVITQVVVDKLEVVATIESFEQPLISERYVEECKRLELEPIKDLQLELQSAQESGVLNLSNANLCPKQCKALCEALKDTDVIQTLDISFTYLHNSAQLMETVCTMSKLEDLNLACVGLTKRALSSLTRLKCPLNHLDISYNSLEASSTVHIAQLIENCTTLATLRMKSTELNAADFRSNDKLAAAVMQSNVRLELDEHLSRDEQMVQLFNQRLGC